MVMVVVVLVGLLMAMVVSSLWSRDCNSLKCDSIDRLVAVLLLSASPQEGILGLINSLFVLPPSPGWGIVSQNEESSVVSSSFFKSVTSLMHQQPASQPSSKAVRGHITSFTFTARHRRRRVVGLCIK
uniref:Putative secreted protein n=1 Tax=Anopheles darlingi TaxID=43151 RepID=A0A2M4DG87_ANODA